MWLRLLKSVSCQSSARRTRAESTSGFISGSTDAEQRKEGSFLESRFTDTAKLDLTLQKLGHERT